MQIKDGSWAGGHDKRATQYFEVLGELTGSKIVKYFTLFVTVFSLLCTGISQIIAIAAGLYYYKDTVSKRCGSLVSKHTLIDTHAQLYGTPCFCNQSKYRCSMHHIPSSVCMYSSI